MEIIFKCLIFCIILFVYLHIKFHLKTSEDLELYEIDEPSKNKLEEICDLRQPVVFDFECEKIMETINKTHISNHYSTFEIKLRNTEEVPETDLYMSLQLAPAIQLFNQDLSSNYFSENNSEFIQETSLLKNIQMNDLFLRPYMVSNCNYDMLFGSDKSCTPFKYEINYRNYFLLTQGSAKIKFAPPHSIKYLQPNYDYEHFEFKSPINPWNPQQKYVTDYNKIKCLEYLLTPGKTFFVPAYWWYSIELTKNACVACFYYKTYMNNIAILPYYSLYALQIQNIKQKNTHKNENENETLQNETLQNENENETIIDIKDE